MKYTSAEMYLLKNLPIRTSTFLVAIYGLEDIVRNKMKIENIIQILGNDDYFEDDQIGNHK